MFRSREKGFIQLGIIALVVLAAGLFAVTKLASNPDLTFFNLGEYAKVSEQDECGGCVDGYQLRWNRDKQRCLRTVTAKCNPVIQPKPTPIYSDPPKPTPTPTPTPCPGLKAKAACDPKATSADKKCCSPFVCEGTWNPRLGKYENYSCGRSLQKAL